MLRSILIGLDGSAYSKAAVEVGVSWAQKLNALVVGLAITDEPEITRSQSVPLGAGAYKSQRDQALLADARRQVEQFLNQFADRCTAAGVAYKLLEDVGRPADQIVLQAQRYDLILLGKQTYFSFETSDQPDETLATVLKNSPRPVVAVPENAPTGGPVVIAYDASLQAARTLQAFQSLLATANEPIHVISVHADQVEAARRADRAIDFLGFHGVQAQAHAIAGDSHPASIIEESRRLGAGLLVMGAYGQPVLREFFFGSTTQALVRETTIPLFLYH
jgi:nucleotide-binding universal stress UspA family protein